MPSTPRWVMAPKHRAVGTEMEEPKRNQLLTPLRDLSGFSKNSVQPNAAWKLGSHCGRCPLQLLNALKEQMKENR